MKFINVFAILMLFGFVQNSHAQLSGIGIQPKMNFARHLNVVQDLPKSQARSVDSRLAAPGIDAFADFNLGNKWVFRAKAGYETKGFVSTIVGYDLVKGAQKYHFISTDFNIIRKWGDKTRIQPYTYIGITTSYNFKKQVNVVDGYLANGIASDVTLTYENYDKFNIGVLGGVGLSFDDVIWCELAYNRDIIAPIHPTNLKVYNTVYSVNVGLNLLKLLKK